jgi:Protein of unknown function (DUF3866)
VIQWREARVLSVGRQWPGALEVQVELPDSSGGCRALAYPALVGRPEPGDLVLLNTTALERGLGTGGYALVIAIPGRIPADAGAGRGPGHLVKARYTPLQAMVLGVDEQESQHHAVLADADDLSGMPVVVADLHSSLPAVLAGLRAPDGPPPGGGQAGPPRVAYVMSDGGALPVWFSRTVASLREAGWLTACISAGQAFGGDLEAVSVHSALLAARHVLACDVAIVIQGPGNLGTGTRWGFSGVAAGEAVNAAAALGGRPVACLRISQADARERHQGISHHSLTAYGRVALAPADVVVPQLAGREAAGLAALGISPEQPDQPRQAEQPVLTLDQVARLVDRQIGELVAPAGRHREVRIGLAGLPEALAACPVSLSTMGRGLTQDPAAFLAAAAAGRHAAALLTS